MKRLSFLLLAASAGVAVAQIKLKPLSLAPKSPAEALVGVWYGNLPAGEEMMTFRTNGEVVFGRGPVIWKRMKYKVDVSVVPWRLDMTDLEDPTITVYAVFDFPEDGVFRMSPAAPSAEERGGKKELEASKLRLSRVVLPPGKGIYQVVQAHLKTLSGTWEAPYAGKQKMLVTFNMDGTYTMKAGEQSDSGHFTLDVTTVPQSINLLSSEGGGPRYSRYEKLENGNILLANGGRTPDKRPADCKGPGAIELVRKAPAGK